MFILRRRGSCKAGGTLTCTWCNSKRLKLWETFPPDREIWKCKDCGTKITYITTPMSIDDVERINHPSEHPYKHLKRSPFVTKIPIIGGKKKIPILKF